MFGTFSTRQRRRAYYRRALGVIFLLGLGQADAGWAAEVLIGPGRDLKTLQAGINAAQPHDRVILDEGIYTDTAATVDKPLTIVGAGRGAVLRVTKPIPNRKGILVVNADLTIRKVTFEGAFVTDADGKNGAGIRYQSGRLIVDTCVFNNNQNGILANPDPKGSILIRRSTFNGNGGGDGYTHGIYIGAISALTVTDSIFAGTKVGHDIKSRALKTTIADTVLDDGVTGTPSYAIDLPNGGEAVIRGVRITQGTRTSNTSMIAFGAENALHERSSLAISESTFVNRASNSIAVNNFTALTITLSGNTFESVGEVTRGPARITPTTAIPPLREGAVFSGLEPNARSFLRFHNTGSMPGFVGVQVFDGRSGRDLGTWTSPQIPPNASPQFSIAVLENALGILDRPPTYSLAVYPSMTGTFQHVLHRGQSGLLLDLSACSAGLASPGPQLGNVHTSILDAGYPASVVVRNEGAVRGSAQLGLYDSRQGERYGGFITAEIPVDGELIIPVGVMEAAAQAVPSWDMAHWVVKIENGFDGSLQQLIANQGAGVFSDVSTVCALRRFESEPGTAVGVGAVFPSSLLMESLLNVYNMGATSAPFHVAIFDAASGNRVADWDSPAIAANASRQFGLAGMLPSLPTEQVPRFYRLIVDSGFRGFVQYLIRQSAGATVSNLSTCDSGTSAGLNDVVYLRASRSQSSDVALVVLNNFGTERAAASLDIFDASDGHLLGSISSDPVAPHANATMTIVDLEYKLNLGPDEAVGAYNVRLKSGFPGTLRYLLLNPYTGAVSDMTRGCAVEPAYQ